MSTQPLLSQAPGSSMVSVADILCRTGHELRNLADISDQAQAVINGLIRERANGHSKQLYDLQSLDRLRQAISGVADFLEALAAAAPSHWLLDASQASQAVTLSDLASRLASYHSLSATSHSAASGDCQFF